MVKTGLTAAFLVTLMAFLGGCVPAQAAPAEGGFDWTLIVFLVLIVGVFYFMMIRPQQDKSHR